VVRSDANAVTETAMCTLLRQIPGLTDADSDEQARPDCRSASTPLLGVYAVGGRRCREGPTAGSHGKSLWERATAPSSPSDEGRDQAPPRPA
jgi:hypothetical protein